MRITRRQGWVGKSPHAKLKAVLLLPALRQGLYDILALSDQSTLAKYYLHS